MLGFVPMAFDRRRSGNFRSTFGRQFHVLDGNLDFVLAFDR